MNEIIIKTYKEDGSFLETYHYKEGHLEYSLINHNLNKKISKEINLEIETYDPLVLSQKAIPLNYIHDEYLYEIYYQGHYFYSLLDEFKEIQIKIKDALAQGGLMEEKEIKRLTKIGRDFMKFSAEQEFGDFKSDQELKKPQPPLVKAPMRDEAIDLPKNFEDLKIEKDFTTIIMERKSHRVYKDEPMTLLELSYLLYTTQSVTGIRGNNYAALRPVPSGGARHGFETYLIVKNVEGLEPGKYHYLPMDHKLEYLGVVENVDEVINTSLVEQTWTTKANVIFYWSFVAYRCEWRYGIYAHRPALMDAGHLGQNLYLACTAINLGTCCIAAYDNATCDALFELDGEEEFIVYTSPVGKI